MANETIFDPLRKKRVILTPEESVRQQFILWLIKERGFRASLMASEWAINFGKKLYRCDIVAFNRQMKPCMIVECKAETVTLNRLVMEQIIRYNFVLKVNFLVITNGVTTFVCKLDFNSKTYEFIDNIPYYESIY